MHRSLITLVFLALMGWFLFGSAESNVPIPERDMVTKDMVAPTTLREPTVGEPTILVAGTEKACQECHSKFESNPRPVDRMVQHLDIRLDHGDNNACLNCHDDDDRGQLVLRGGETVAFQDAPLLCATCHGPTARDWEAGSHGRTNGYWDTSRGTSEKKSCVACHDPHHPAFPELVPFPGPNTLRLVKPEHPYEVHLEGALGRYREVVDAARVVEAKQQSEDAAAAAKKLQDARARYDEENDK